MEPENTCAIDMRPKLAMRSWECSCCPCARLFVNLPLRGASQLVEVYGGGTIGNGSNHALATVKRVRAMYEHLQLRDLCLIRTSVVFALSQEPGVKRKVVVQTGWLLPEVKLVMRSRYDRGSSGLSLCLSRHCFSGGRSVQSQLRNGTRFRASASGRAMHMWGSRTVQKRIADINTRLCLDAFLE
jgi:hypothetical protein